MGVRRSEGGANELNMEESTERYYEERFAFFFFNFLHCRTSARHGRSTLELACDRVQISPEERNQQQNHPKQATPTHKPRHGPGKSAREICKLSETR